MDEYVLDSDAPATSEGTLTQLAKADIDQQIATAHKYPRSIARFRKSVQEMVTLSDAIAACQAKVHL